MTYAIPDDVAVELGRSTSSITFEQAAQWQAWLERVERAIARGFRRAGLNLSDQIAANTVSQDDVRDVEVAAVVRKVQNPTFGETSYTKSLDDGSVTRRREGAADVDPLDLLPSELDSLLPSVQSDAVSTRPGFQPDRACVGLDW